MLSQVFFNFWLQILQQSEMKCKNFHIKPIERRVIKINEFQSTLHKENTSDGNLRQNINEKYRHRELIVCKGKK